MRSLRRAVVPGTALIFGWMSKMTVWISRRASSKRRWARRACRVVVTTPPTRLADTSTAAATAVRCLRTNLPAR